MDTDMQKLRDIFKALEANVSNDVIVSERLREAEGIVSANTAICTEARCRSEIAELIGNLWNATVRFALSQISNANNAKLRLFCVTTAMRFIDNDSDIVNVKQVVVMCLKTVRDLLSLRKLNEAQECISKTQLIAPQLRAKLQVEKENMGEANWTALNFECESMLISAAILECELLGKKDDHEAALGVGEALSAEVSTHLECVPQLVVASHNTAVEAFAKHQYNEAARWIKLCYVVSKKFDASATGSKLSFMLRMFAQLAFEHSDVKVFVGENSMETDGRDSQPFNLRAALQAIDLANSEDCTSQGLFLKALILIKMRTGCNDRDLSDCDKHVWRELLENQRLDLNTCLSIVARQFETQRAELFTYALEILSSRFESTTEAYRLRLAQLECSLRSSLNQNVITEQLRSALNSAIAVLVRDVKSVGLNDLQYQHRVQSILWQRAEAALMERQFSVALTWLNYSLMFEKQSEELSPLSAAAREQLGWCAQNVCLLHVNRTMCYLELEDLPKAREALKTAMANDACTTPSEQATLAHVMAFRIHLIDQTADACVAAIQKALATSLDDKPTFTSSRTCQVVQSVMFHLLQCANSTLKCTVLDGLVDTLVNTFVNPSQSDQQNLAASATQSVVSKDSTCATYVLRVVKSATKAHISAIASRNSQRDVSTNQNVVADSELLSRVLKYSQVSFEIISLLRGLEGHGVSSHSLASLNTELRWFADVLLTMTGYIERSEFASETKIGRLMALFESYEMAHKFLAVIASEANTGSEVRGIRLVIAQLCLQLAKIRSNSASKYCETGLAMLRAWSASATDVASESETALHVAATEFQFFVLSKNYDEAFKCIRVLEVQLHIEKSLEDHTKVGRYIKVLETVIQCSLNSSMELRQRNDLVIRLARLLVNCYHFVLSKLNQHDPLCAKLNQQRSEAITLVFQLLFDQLKLYMQLGSCVSLIATSSDAKSGGLQFCDHEKIIIECCDWLFKRDELVNVEAMKDDDVLFIMQSCWNHGVKYGMMDSSTMAEFWCSLAIRVLGTLNDKQLLDHTQKHLWTLYRKLLRGAPNTEELNRS